MTTCQNQAQSQFTGKYISLRNPGSGNSKSSQGNRIKEHAARRAPSVESREHGLDRRTGMRRLTGGGSSVVEDCKVQLAQACRIGDRLNLDDLAACDREIEDEEQMSTRRHNSCHGSIHESRSCALSTS